MAVRRTIELSGLNKRREVLVRTSWNCGMDTACIDEYMPSELLMQVFGWLDVSSLANASAVCRRWHSLARSDYVWKRMYYRSFADLGLSKPPAEEWLCWFKHHHQRLEALVHVMHDLNTDKLREELGDMDVFLNLCNLGVQDAGLSVTSLVQFWIACGAPDTWERSLDTLKASEMWGRVALRHRVMLLASLGKFFISAIDSLDAGQEHIERGIGYFEECLELLRAYDDELARWIDPLFIKCGHESFGHTPATAVLEQNLGSLTVERKELLHAYYHIYHWLGEAYYVSSTDMPHTSGLDTAEMYFKRGYTLQQLIFPSYHITKAQSLMKMSGVSWRRFLDRESECNDGEREYTAELATCEALMMEAWLHAIRWAEQARPLDCEEEVASAVGTTTPSTNDVVAVASSNAWLNVYTLAEIIAGLGNIACTKGDIDQAVAYHRIGVNRATRLWGETHPLTIFHMLQLYDVLPEEDEQLALMDTIRNSDWWSTSISKLLGLTFLFPTVYATARWTFRIFHPWVYV